MGTKLGIFREANPTNHSWTETNGNTNPFNVNVLATQAICATVNSIPSPYARMHLFELGFRQLAGGVQNVSDEMQKCVSHCLDVYELLFRCRTSEKLHSNGIKIAMHKYQDTTDIPMNSSEYKYLDALSIFRKSYTQRYRIPQLDANGNFVIDNRNNVVKVEDTNLFKTFFTISKGDQIIAATSPFTGFYVKDNPAEVSIDGMLFFASQKYGANHDLQWKNLTDRELDFQKFMYKLIRYLVVNLNTTSFSERYADFWNYVNNQIDAANRQEWDGVSFSVSYPEFDLSGLQNGTFGFPIFTNNNAWQGQGVFVIPNEYDSCVLKFLIAPDNFDHFKLTPRDYDADILGRTNPLNKRNFPWVSVDDFLDDYINIIQGEVNNLAYFCVQNDLAGDNAGGKYQVLPPLKSRFFEFFSIDDLTQNGANNTPLVKFNLQHRRNDDGTTECLFTIKVPYQIDNTIRYISLSKVYDNDHCRTGVGLELGIYPFFKTPSQVDDFYRVACYASNSMNCTDLELVRLNNGYMTGAVVLDADDINNRHYINKSNGITDISAALNSKIFYYALNGTFTNDNIGLAPHKDVSFDLLKLKYDIQQIGNVLYREQIVVPLMKTLTLNPGTLNIAIDLGTTNTYVCYAPKDSNPKPFESSSNIGPVHFVKLSKVVETSPSISDKDRYDMGDVYRLTQRCELIPAYFEQNNGYHFPIPTALNIKGTTTDQLINHRTDPLSPLFNVNIPFSYYEDGTRSYNGIPIDNVHDNFKWFGLAQDDKKAEVMLYAEQLCLMIRNKLLANGRDLSDVNLYFTYPLAFDGNSQGFYRQMWKKIYAKYFCKTADPLFMNEANANIDNINKVKWDTESRTPLFSDPELLGDNRIMLVDIGGGSEDVMVYHQPKDQPAQIERCFSFKFAGNNLFCDDILNKNNVWYREIFGDSNLLPQAVAGQCPGLTTNKAVADPEQHNVGMLMNKCFSDKNLNDKVTNKLTTAYASSLLLTLHNSAIIYSMADLCRALNWIPDILFFSGNGSKLLFLNDANNATRKQENTLELITRKIFSCVFPEREAKFNAMTIRKSADPKAATANGIIIGLNNQVNIGSGNVEHWVDYGQKGTNSLYRVNAPGMKNPNGEPIPLTRADLWDDFKNEKTIYNGVMENVNDFLRIYFTDVLPFFPDLFKKFVYDSVSKTEMVDNKRNVYYFLSIIRNSFEDGYKKGLPTGQADSATDSLFLSVISQIINDLCKSL